MKFKSWSFLSVVLALLLAFGGLMVQTLPAAAQSSGPEGGARDRIKQMREGALERTYQRELNWLAAQEDHLNNARTLASKTREWLKKASEKGLDVSALESALDALEAAIAAAQGHHDQAAAVLNAHAGFDDAGKVTDPVAARETVANAHRALSDAHMTLQKGIIDFRQALRAWRDAHRPTPQPQPQP